jgi:hypothetical protein
MADVLKLPIIIVDSDVVVITTNSDFSYSLHKAYRNVKCPKCGARWFKRTGNSFTYIVEDKCPGSGCNYPTEGNKPPCGPTGKEGEGHTSHTMKPIYHSWESSDQIGPMLMWRRENRLGKDPVWVQRWIYKSNIVIRNG